jgi:hypothetical protein
MTQQTARDWYGYPILLGSTYGHDGAAANWQTTIYYCVLASYGQRQVWQKGNIQN